MPCYKTNGCGEFTQTPCHMCPASRPTWKDRNEQRKITYPEPEELTAGTTLGEPRRLEPEELTEYGIRMWLCAHPVIDRRFALKIPKNIKPDAYKVLTEACSEHKTAAMEIANKILQPQSLYVGLEKPANMSAPDEDRPYFQLRNIPSVDPFQGTVNDLVMQYNLVQTFDIACIAAWYYAIYVTDNNIKPERIRVTPNSSYQASEMLDKLKCQISNALPQITRNAVHGKASQFWLTSALVKANVPFTDAVRLVHPITRSRPEDLIQETQTYN